MISALLRIYPVAAPVYYAGKMFADYFLFDKVTPVKGSVVYVSLLGPILEHTGIYIGNGKIVHRNSSGLIEAVDEEEFMRNTTAISIYVSSQKDQAIGSSVVAERAISSIGTRCEYTFYDKNCHHFVIACLLGNFKHDKFLFTQVEDVSQKVLRSDNWRIWDT